MTSVGCMWYLTCVSYILWDEAWCAFVQNRTIVVIVFSLVLSRAKAQSFKVCHHAINYTWNTVPVCDITVLIKVIDKWPKVEGVNFIKTSRFMTGGAGASLPQHWQWILLLATAELLPHQGGVSLRGARSGEEGRCSNPHSWMTAITIVEKWAGVLLSQTELTVTQVINFFVFLSQRVELHLRGRRGRREAVILSNTPCSSRS